MNKFHVLLLLDSKQHAHGGFFNGIVLKHNSLSMLLTTPTSYIHDLCPRFDDSYMGLNVFGGRRNSPFVLGYLNIVEEDEHHS
jgi:hypothetical protein